MARTAADRGSNIPKPVEGRALVQLVRAASPYFELVADVMVETDIELVDPRTCSAGIEEVA